MRRYTSSVLLFTVMAAPALGQLGVFSQQDLVRLTPHNPYERFSDGRPKVPDALLERLKSVTVEDAWGVLRGEGYVNQWEGGWTVIKPEEKLVGRVYTAQFMPLRPDLNEIIDKSAEQMGLSRSQNLRVIDQLQRNDVVVVDMFGKIEQGTFVGGNLATAVFARTRTGFVIDGSVRDFEEIRGIDRLTAYVRGLHPSAIGSVMLAGLNIPLQIGSVTVLPGDIVLGDGSGLVFIPPHLVEKVLESSEKTRLKDEFTKMKMLEGKHDPSQIYPTMSDEVTKEYEEWLKKQ